MSVAEYVKDPRFLVHGVAIRRGGVSEFHVDAKAALAALTADLGEGWPGVTVVMHNAAFDAYILDRVYGIRPHHIVCTMSAATALLGRGNASLRSVADHFGLPAKGEIATEGYRTLSREQTAALAEYACHDADLTYEIAGRLLACLPRPEVELPLIEHTVRMGVERALMLDRPGAVALKAEVEAETAALVSATGLTATDLRSAKKLSAAMQWALSATGRKLPTKRGKSGEIAPIAKTDHFMQQALNDSDPAVQALARARLAVMGTSQTVARIDALLRLDAAHGGVPPVLAYHAAHTGRWSGSGSGVNLHGFPKRGGGINTRIRGLLCARPGHILAVADLAAIEPRVLAWLVGETSQLAAFREGRDLYCEFASGLFGEPVRKATNEDPPDLAAVLTARRSFAKAAVLGLGYRMGGKRFWEGCQSTPDLAAAIAAGTVDAKVAVRAVREYRARYRAVSSIWKALDAAATAVVIGGGVRSIGPLALGMDGADLLLGLPSGRRLRYPDAKVENEEREMVFLDDDGREAATTIGGPQVCASMPEVKTFHGGLFVENVVQALARDVLAEAILRIEAGDLPVVLHVHDEVVVEVPEADGDAALAAVIEELRRPPPWAADLPLDAEGWVGPRYGK